jgi:pimeloyl-ACP methyl ester carboxylesterase
VTRVFGFLAAAAAGLVLAGAARAQDAPANPAQTWWPGYLANARGVKLPDGRTMNLYCEGKGSPVVVLDSGLGDGAWSWAKTQDRMAERTRVCSYDRAGYGKSSPGPLPRDAKAIVADMAEMLKAAREKGPYVLVSHSLGSFDVRLFALTRPEAVAGLVLVDPSADGQVRRMTAVAPKMQALQDAAMAGARPCAVSPRPPERAKLCVLGTPAATPEAQAYLAASRSPDFYRGMLSEADSLDADGAELAAAREALSAKRKGAAPLAGMPLVILTAGNQGSPGLSPEDNAAVRKVWGTMHDEMATLSTRGVNRTVEGSAHYIHQEKPQVVIDAVAEVVDAVRAGRR